MSKKTSIILYLFVFSIIYQSGSVKAAVLNDGFLFELTRILIIFLPFIILLKMGITKRIVNYAFLFSIIGILWIFINYILYSAAIIRLAYKIIIFVLSLCVCMRLAEKNIDISDYIYNSIIFIVITSFCFYIIIEILHLNMPYKVIQKGVSYEYRCYFELFFSYHYNQLIPRFSGLFWEPGVNAIYINIALFIYVFEKKSKKTVLLLLLLSLMLTQSTTGYAIGVYLMALYLIKDSYSKNNVKDSKKVLLVFLIIVATLLSFKIVQYKFEKTGHTETGSAFLRYNDLVDGLKTWIKHPIFGTGFGNKKVSFNYSYLKGRGNSNGLVTYMYMTGILGMIIALTPYVQNVLKTDSRSRELIWFLMILLFNFSEPIYDLPIMAFLLALEYTKLIDFNSKKREKKRNEIEKYSGTLKGYRIL